MGECQLCGEGKGLTKLRKCPTELEEKAIECGNWVQSSNGYLKKAFITTTTNELVAKAVAASSHFIKHCYINKNQATAFAQDRQEASSNHSVAVVQVDFAENFGCIQQDEVHSSYWNRQQITLFTGVIWQNGKSHSLCVCSDSKDHIKEEVFVYLMQILERVNDRCKFVRMWSDGPSSHFKNRFIVPIINHLKDHFGMQITRNYFCAGHGKGTVDGVGASVKRTMYNLIKSRRAVVICLDSFANAFNQHHSSSVELITVPCSKISDILDQYNMKNKFSIAPSLRGITASHCITMECGEPCLHRLSAHANASPAKSALPSSSSPKEGEWMAVIYDDNFVLGEIAKACNQTITVNFMRSSGANRYQWPENPDTDIINYKDILCHSTAPELMSGAGRVLFSLPAREYNRIVDIFLKSS